MKQPSLAASGVHFKPVLGLLPRLLRSPKRLKAHYREHYAEELKAAREELVKTPKPEA